MTNWFGSVASENLNSPDSSTFPHGVLHLRTCRAAACCRVEQVVVDHVPVVAHLERARVPRASDVLELVHVEVVEKASLVLAAP